MPRIVWVNSGHNDYLGDGVFHGLRTLLGPSAIDLPRADYLYDTAPREMLDGLHGRGFTLYGLLQDVPVERDHVLGRAVIGEVQVDLVLFSAIREPFGTFGLWTQWGPQLRQAGIQTAVLDGSDSSTPYPFGGPWWRRPSWWFLPRAHNRGAYFKREITPRTRWAASYLLLPPAIGRKLALRPISFSIPAEKIVGSPPPKTSEFPRHVVDPEVASRIGAKTGYAFTSELDYYEDLRRSRYGVTTKRAGWDALRHYEIAANGAVPCFRDLDRKPELCAPFGLNDKNSISYRDTDDLFAKLASINDQRYVELQAGAINWAWSNTTVSRARQLLEGLGMPLDTKAGSALPQGAQKEVSGRE